MKSNSATALLALRAGRKTSKITVLIITPLSYGAALPSRPPNIRTTATPVLFICRFSGWFFNLGTRRYERRTVGVKVIQRIAIQ